MSENPKPVISIEFEELREQYHGRFINEFCYKDGKFELELKDVKVYHEINIPFVDFFSTEEYNLSKFLLKNEILIEKGETIMVSVKKNDN